MSADFDFKFKLQLFVINKIKSIKHTESQLDESYCLLEQMSFLVNLNECNQEIENNFATFSMSQIKSEFKTSFYQICLKELLINLDVTKKSDNQNVTLDGIKNQLIQIISSTNYSDSFNVLYDLCTGLK
jgi:hypothetical protein